MWRWANKVAMLMLIWRPAAIWRRDGNPRDADWGFVSLRRGRTPRDRCLRATAELSWRGGGTRELCEAGACGRSRRTSCPDPVGGAWGCSGLPGCVSSPV